MKSNKKLHHRKDSEYHVLTDMPSEVATWQNWKTPQWFYISIAFFCLLIIGVICYSSLEGHRISDVHVPQMAAVLKLHNEVTTAHLWFEEILSGDRNQEMSIVWGSLDMADEYAQAILVGGRFDFGEIMPMTDPKNRELLLEIREVLREFQAATDLRWREREISGPGTGIDQEYDAIYEIIVNLADNAEALTIALIQKDRRIFQVSQISLLGACLFLFVTVGVILYRNEKHRLASYEVIKNSKEKLELDLVRRKKIEKELAQSRREYQTLASMSPVGIFRTDINGQATYLNEAYLSIAGLTFESIREVGWMNGIHPDDRSLVIEKWNRSVIDGSPFELEYRFRRPSGDDSWVLGHAVAEHDEDGKLIGYIGTVTDITASKVAAVALQASEKKYHTLAEVASVGIFHCDVDGKIEYANQAWCQFSGMTLVEATETYWWEIINANDKDRVREEWRRATQKDHYFSSEFQILRTDGAIYEVLCRAKLEVGEDGNAIGYVVTITDITELKVAEEELLRSSKQLAHHIQNTPLGVIEWDLDMRVVSWNRSAERIFGYTEMEAKGKNCIGLIVEPDKADDLLLAWKELLGQSGGQRNAHPSINKAGESLICDWYNTAITNDKDEVIGVATLVEDITARRQAVEDLKKSEETYRSIFEAAANLITSVNSDGIIVDCNNRSFALLGYTREELIGKSVTEIIHPGYHEKALRHIQRLIATGVSYGNEYKFIRKDGKEIDICINSSSLKDKDGKFERSLCILSDITEQKLISDTLKTIVVGTAPETGTEFFRSLVAHLATALDVRYALIGEYLSNEKNLVRTLALWAGDSFGENIEYELKGTPCENVVGKTVCVYPENVQHMFPDDALLGAMEAESYIGVPLFGSSGQVLGLMAILDDKPFSQKKIRLAESLVTIFASRASSEFERQRIENALKESESRFRSLVETSQDLIWKCDAEGRFTYLNQAWERTLGFSLDEMLGHCFSEFQPPDIAERDKREFGQHLAGGSVHGYETVHISKAGKPVNLVFNAIPLIDEHGNVVGTQGTAHDVSETKRLQELEARAQRLETAGQIAGQVAHDFNNLLAPLMAYPEFIRDELPENHPVLGFVNDIENAAQQIAEINQQLLTLGRRGHYNLDVINLNNLIDQSLRQIDEAPDSLTIALEYAEDLSNIKGGKAQLTRAITNIVLNAREAMQDIGQLRIKTENFYVDEMAVNYGRIPRGEYIKVTISDTGCGISDDIKSKILDPFFTTKVSDKKRGSGLGLSVVAAVIDDHNSYLDLSSEIGKGTSFYLYFPITHEEEKEDISPELRGGSETLLVVDDDFIQRKVALRILSRLGYEVVTVESGEKAIELVKQRRFDLIVLDMIIPPGIDGAETYRQILEIYPDQKAVIVSGFAESDRVAEVQRLGAGDFIKKPLSYTKFAQAVRNELDRKTEIATL